MAPVKNKWIQKLKMKEVLFFLGGLGGIKINEMI